MRRLINPLHIACNLNCGENCKHTTMATSEKLRTLETRDDASAAIKQILCGNTERSELVPSDRFKKLTG